MYCIMQYMSRPSVSMRELQQNLKRVIARVERGETVELTRRRRVVARLVPARGERAVPPWPDLEARARSVMGDRLITDPSPSELVIRDRGEW
jgi:prevent-host-death family protein